MIEILQIFENVALSQKKCTMQVSGARTRLTVYHLATHELITPHSCSGREGIRNLGTKYERFLGAVVGIRAPENVA